MSVAKKHTEARIRESNAAYDTQLLHVSNVGYGDHTYAECLRGRDGAVTHTTRGMLTGE